MLRNCTCNATGPTKDQKLACSDNPGENIWCKME